MTWHQVPAHCVRTKQGQVWPCIGCCRGATCHLEQASLVAAPQRGLAQTPADQLAVHEDDPAVCRIHAGVLAGLVDLLLGLQVDIDPAALK